MEVLYDPVRHEPLRPLPWAEGQVRAAIEHIVADAEARFTDDGYWPFHPLDAGGPNKTGRVNPFLYDGACGVFWALHYLRDVGAATLSRNWFAPLERLLARNPASFSESAVQNRASFMEADTPIRMMVFGSAPTDELESALDALIAGNLDHPARELMFGSPGTMLAALFLHERTGNRRWADLFRLTADTLWSQLEWSTEHQCAYWTQEFAGHRFAYLDGVHGFVGTALPLIRGRHLLDAVNWKKWEECIVNTVQRTVDRVGAHANWRPEMDRAADPKMLLQFCHGAPGFVICLAGLPGTALDDVLLAAGETIWSAGPLTKGSNLCHGTGGNGYAFLKLYQRTGDARWLERARAFAMHGIAQTREATQRYGQGRYSLWTGDPGFAVYLWDCIRAEAQFPTLDVFYASRARGEA